MSYTTSVGMLEEVKDHSDAGCDRFYRTYRPLVLLHGRDCGVSGADLDDLVQIVMVEFFRNDHFVYDSGKGRFRSFLRRIIHARSMDMLRMRRRERKRAELVSPDEAFYDRCEEEEYRAFVRREALDRLRTAVAPAHFQQFMMLVVEGRSVREVARFFAVPEASVYSAFRRTRRKLVEIVRDVESRAF